MAKLCIIILISNINGIVHVDVHVQVPLHYNKLIHTCTCTHASTLYLSYRAAALGHFEAIQTLSAYGADFTLKTAAGENAMHFATKNYRLLCTRLLGQRGRNLSRDR